MPTAQSRANLKYYHKRASTDPEYSQKIAQNRMERYYLNQEEEKERAKMYYQRKKARLLALNVPAEKTEEITT
jgi:ribosomal protein S4